MGATRWQPHSDVELVQQLSGLSQVGSFEALSELGVNGFEANTPLASLALPQAKSREARCRAKLPRQRSLAARTFE